jgi:sporulation protein YlmC with PRC-barrel domain
VAEVDLARDCLDKQVVDREGHKMGRVDGIVIEVGDDQAPTVSAVKIGSVCQAERLHPKVGKFVSWLSKRCGVVNHDPFRLPWSKIVCAEIEAIAGVEAEATPALAWELWLRKHVIARFPLT